MHFEIKLNTQMSSDCKATKSKETVYMNDSNGKKLVTFLYTTEITIIRQHLDYATVLLYDICIMYLDTCPIRIGIGIKP